jgi:hypothetical protein
MLVPAGQEACQVKSTVRFEAPWIPWMNVDDDADQPLLVWFGR